jgi:hypothetical protein
MEAFGPDPYAAVAMPVLYGHWTLTPVCCTGLAAQKFRLAKLKPFSVAPPPPDGSSSAAPRPSPIDPFTIFASPKIRLDLNDALCSLSSSDDRCILLHGYVIYMMLFSD